MNIARIATIADLVLGVWLVLWAVFVPQGQPQAGNAVIVGMLSVALALTSVFWIPAARLVNAALGVWLIASLWALPWSGVGVVVNNLIVGTLMFGFSVAPVEARPRHAPSS